MDYEDPVDRAADSEDAAETTCCFCGGLVAFEYATAIVLTPPGDEAESEQQLFCHGHHLPLLVHRSVALHPAIAGDVASEEEPQDEDPALSDALDAQLERNDQLFDELQALGVNLTALAPILVQFVAQKHIDAAHLAAALRDDGYLLLVLAPEADESGPWHVEASIEQTPETAGSDEVTRDLVRLAASFDAEYGGWSINRAPR